MNSRTFAHAGPVAADARSQIGALTTLMVALLIVGCENSPPVLVDDERVERAIRDEAGTLTINGLGEVECPEDVARVAGGTFTCTLTGRTGTPNEVRVTQTDADGSFEIELATLIVERVESTIADELTERLDRAISAVDCGNDRPLRAGDRFECTSEFRDDGSDLIIAVTQTDGTGGIEWELR